jgi:hypothetical protein
MTPEAARKSGSTPKVRVPAGRLRPEGKLDPGEGLIGGSFASAKKGRMGRIWGWKDPLWRRK